MNRRSFLCTGLAPFVVNAAQSKLVHPGPGGKLVYVPDANGNRIPDFSNCGYMGGGVDIPVLPVRAELRPESGDATARIQAAIDKVSALPANERGVVLLAKGRYEIGGSIRIAASGVVLRGEGAGEGGTVLAGTGNKPRTLIQLRGTGYGKPYPNVVKVVDEYVPVGARSFRIASTKGLRPGSLILLRRIGNAAWIHEIAMDRIKPRPGAESGTKQWAPFNLDMERVITGIDGDRVTIDAPVTCAIESRWGGGEVALFDDSDRIRNVGVEDLRGVSSFDRNVTAVYGPKKETYFSDEAHATTLISIENANNAWVRDVTALYFNFACVDVRRSRGITVQDCDCREMVSVITGGRRYPYCLGGQLTLVQRCKSDTARHDFVLGSRVPGPNVFLHCTAGRSFATSEPHHRWSVGGLYDNVKADIAIQDRQYYGSGHGWAGANYVAWNCEGSLVCQNPPTAQNWAIGHIGRKEPGAFAPRPDGIWDSAGRHVEPASLYLRQVEERRKA